MFSADWFDLKNAEQCTAEAAGVPATSVACLTSKQLLDMFSSGCTSSLAYRSQRSRPHLLYRLYSSRTSEIVSKKLSRKERRSILRKQKNRERRQSGSVNGRGKPLSLVDRMNNLMVDYVNPKVPGGGNLHFTRQHVEPLFYRVPLATLLYLLATNEECFPYIIQGSIGPSMLPTIQYIGDLWLIETWAWHRVFGRQIDLAVGDVVIWKDPKTQRVSCKRIIGMEGDTVKRFGQYVHLYKDREDLGIAAPKDVKLRNVPSDWDSYEKIEANNVDRTVTIPPDHVWVEGDCPPFSLDSRHCGFIEKNWIKGRLLYRVWPFRREDKNGNQIPFRVSQRRPVPFPSIDGYLGWRYNFHKVSKQSKAP